MNCPFCQQECPTSNYFTYASDPGAKGFKCLNHQYRVELIERSIALTHTCYYVVSRPSVKHPDQFDEFLVGYQWNDKNEGLFQIWEGNLKRSSTHHILKLEFVPWHITPDNIDKKISTILTFL